MMDFEKALDAMFKIEEEVDVNSIRILSTQIWPLIRMLIWYQMMDPEKNHTQLEGQEHSYRFTLTPETRKAIAIRSQTEPIDLLLFSSSAYYTDKAGGALYNRHVDPFSDLFGKEFRILNSELEDSGSRTRQPRKFPSLILGFSEERKPVRHRTAPIPGFDDLHKAVLFHTGIDIDFHRVIEDLRRLSAFRSIFCSVLEHLKPRAIGVICYYHLPAMGLVWAGRKKGIPCVDIQHGKQGRYHGMYTHWTATPSDGYELLPTRFWMWGDESRENIAKWLPKQCHSPKVEILGSPWLSLWTEGPGCEPTEDWTKRLITRIANRKVILFSMQPLKEGALPVELFHAIRHSPPSWLWLVRLHPKEIAQQDIWTEFFSKNSLENVECTLANNLPLFTLLKNSHHHVTCFSSVAFEALSFGLSTTLIHHSGKLLYNQYLHEGYFRYADSYKEIILSVKTGLVEEKKQEERPYICHSADNIRTLLKSILHGDKTIHYSKRTGETHANH